MVSMNVELLKTGKTTAGFRIPDEVVAALGGGKRPKVIATINGFEYRSSIARMGGEFWLGVSAERRDAAGVTYGDFVDLEIELDNAPRVVAVPEDFGAALDASPKAKAFWPTLSYSNQQWHVLQIERAKAAETRQRRIAKSIDLLASGRAR